MVDCHIIIIFENKMYSFLYNISYANIYMYMYFAKKIKLFIIKHIFTSNSQSNLTFVYFKM